MPRRYPSFPQGSATTSSAEWHSSAIPVGVPVAHDSVELSVPADFRHSQVASDAALARALQEQENNADLARRHPPPPAHRSEPGESLSELARRNPPPQQPTHLPPPRLERFSSSSGGGQNLHRPYFCAFAFLLNVGIFVLEIRDNGWQFQPFACPAACANGSPCFEDGTPCEANPLLGPSISVLDQMGAKNDVRIFEAGEWWRIVTCNWMHAGVLHLLFNMMGVWRVGGDLERIFGPLRVGALYIFSGLFGTICSIVLLPGILSVGASASVFGLVGACWADVIVNFCARCTLKNSGILCLAVATLLNVAIGFTPWVDNLCAPRLSASTRPTKAHIAHILRPCTS